MALFFDGKNASGFHVSISWADGYLSAAGQSNGFKMSWPLSECEIRKAIATRVSLLTADGELLVDLAEWNYLRDAHPDFAKATAARNELMLLVKYGAAGFAVLAVLLIGLRVGSDYLSRMLTIEREIEIFGSIGDSMSSTKSPGLESVLDELKPQQKLAIRLQDAELINAFAAPGARILVTTGLVCFTESPDELSAVVAHEVGHIEHRHLAKSMVATFGMRILVGILSGGSITGDIAGSLLANQYSVLDEKEADSASASSLLKVGINPAAGAKFFDRMSKKADTKIPAVLAILSTHPADESRVAYFTEQAKNHRATRGSALEARSRRATWNKIRKQAKCDAKPAAKSESEK